MLSPRLSHKRLGNLEDIRAAVMDDAVYSFNVDEAEFRSNALCAQHRGWRRFVEELQRARTGNFVCLVKLSCPTLQRRGCPGRV